jgi:molecular chaperone GrpE
MRKTHDQSDINETGPEGVHPEEPNTESENAEGVADAAQPEGMTPEEAEDLVSLARSGDEVPVGAEDFAEALAIVAAQRDEHFDKFQRLGADYQNFQRRARQNERESRELASMGVVQSLLQVLDFFDMAMKQDPATATAAQVIGGVEMIKSEFLRVLGNQGVQPLAPGAGEEFDPLRHEAIERTAQTNVETGRVVETRSPGYAMGDRVMRPAKVVVAAAPDETGSDETGSDDAGEPAGDAPGNGDA